MSATQSTLVQLLLGRVPTEDETPDVMRALRGGARVTYVQGGLDREPRAVILVGAHTPAGEAAIVLRPGRDPVEQLAALGAEMRRRAESPGARIYHFPGSGDAMLAAAEEHVERAIAAQEGDPWAS